MSPDCLLYCILLRSFTSCHHKFAARRSRNDKIQRGFVTPMHNPSPAINQQPNATRYCSAVNGMIILCSQWFAQLPTILTYMLLTVMHRTCSVLHASTETHHIQSNHPISWYLPSSKPYSQSPEPSQGNAHTFLSWIVGYKGWWWWTTMGLYFKMLDSLNKSTELPFS